MATVTGTIFDIKRYALHDGPGIRTTVFFKGCNLDCWWCHNPEGRRAAVEVVELTGRKCGEKQVLGRVVDVESVLAEVERDRVFYEQSGGGVTFSGGEPLLQPEFLAALLRACRARGLHTALDTCGNVPWEVLAKVSPLVDLFLYDIKVVDEAAHKRYTGVSNRLILDNLAALVRDGRKVVPRLALIPGLTDTAENQAAVARVLKPFPTLREISLLPYNKLGEDKFRRFGWEHRLGAHDVQSPEEMAEKRKFFERRGYTVNCGG